MAPSLKIIRYDFNGTSFLDELKEILKNELSFPVLLVVDESIGLKEQIKKVVDTFYKDQEEAFRIFIEIKDQFLDTISQMPFVNESILNDISDIFVESEWLLEDSPQDDYDYVYGQIAGVVPIMVSRVVAGGLIAAGIQTVWLDNRDFLLTDEAYSAARIDVEDSRRKWGKIFEAVPEELEVIVLQNLTGSTVDNATTIIQNFDLEGIVNK